MVGTVEAMNRRQRLLEFAWDETPIGSADQWPQSLRAAVDFMLGVSVPGALFVGPLLVQMHNPSFSALYRDEASAAQALGRSLTRNDRDGPLATGAAQVLRGHSIVLRQRRLMLDAEANAKAFDLSCAPVRDERGQISAMLVLALSAEPATRERGPLVSELQHRVRNILAVVRSLVARSAETSDTVEDLAAHLDGRIAALARVQAVLVRNPNASVDLEGLVRDELLAQNADEDRLRISGPEIVLPSKAAEVLTLAIHELATNAMKYGALSQASGNLEITWRLGDAGAPRQALEIAWLETGVRIASGAPRREGFGTNLLKRRLPYELAGSAELEFRPGGLACRIVFPFAQTVGPPTETAKDVLSEDPK
jgi:two-component sensor histidine kinase